MHEIAMKLRRAAENAVGIGPETKVYIGAAIARALATVLSLPTSPLPNGKLRSWYGETHATTVAEVLSSINEAMMIDTREVLDLTYRFFSLRYDFVHQPDEDRAVRVMMWLSSTDEDVVPPRTREMFQKLSDNSDVHENVVRLMRNAISDMRSSLMPTVDKVGQD